MLIRKELCDICGSCAAVCPVDAISLEEFRAFIDPEKCIECGNCLKICPARAIIAKIIKMEKGKDIPSEQLQGEEAL